MKPYRTDEADFRVPDDWQDNSITALVLPSQSGSSANLVISRDPKPQRSDLPGYADLHLVEAAKKFPGYRLLNRHAILVSGQHTVETDYSWTTPERIEVQQRQTYLMHKGTALIITLSAGIKEFARHEDTWRVVIASFRLKAA